MSLGRGGRRRYKVVEIVANVKQYRRSYYPKLAARLARSDVDLTVVYSDSDQVEASKGDSIDLPPPLGYKVPRAYFAGGRLLLQYVPPRLIAGADLVIIVQATGYLTNYVLLALSWSGVKRVAYSGHGRNHQGDPGSLAERLKRRLARTPDWWFSYTSRTSRYLEAVGMDPARITTMENAVDTTEFRDRVASVSDDEVAAMRQRLGLGPTDFVALYCGSIYREKRIPYLLEAARLVAADLPAFRLVVVGGGADADLVRAAAREHDWLRYAGPLFDRDKAVCFRMSRVFLMPGLVGLGILDSFAARLPMITTADALHSPEIDYLRHGENGLMVKGDEAVYAREVARLLRDGPRLEAMVREASATAERYSVENMVRNVAEGILACLGVASHDQASTGADR